jgi:uncharacterized iron-regulated protein
VEAALLAVTVSLAAACASTPTPPPPPPPHSLVGRIYDVASATFLSEQELAARLVGPRFVLLGEQHDNPYHHLLQARVISLLVASGVRPAVAFEMLATDHVGAIHDCQIEPHCTVEEFRHAVEWDDSGWPAWQLYEPVFRTAINARLPIVAADITHGTLQLLMSGDAERAPERAAWIGYLGLERSMPPAERTELAEEIRESHCNLVPDDMLPQMIRAQRARDSHLALVIERTSASRGTPVVLLAGSGHTRKDRGVPTYFTVASARGATLSLAFVEVDDDKERGPSDYARRFGGTTLPFDIVWFTEEVEREDPCKAHRDKLEAIGNKPIRTREK